MNIISNFIKIDEIYEYKLYYDEVNKIYIHINNDDETYIDFELLKIEEYSDEIKLIIEEKKDSHFNYCLNCDEYVEKHKKLDKIYFKCCDCNKTLIGEDEEHECEDIQCNKLMNNYTNAVKTIDKLKEKMTHIEYYNIYEILDEYYDLKIEKINRY